MRRIVDVAELHDCVVLFLDGPTPRMAWRELLINGKTFSPVPVYDIDNVVAVKGIGFSIGQTVEFL